MLLQTIRIITIIYIVGLTLLLELPITPLPPGSLAEEAKGYEHIVAFTLLGLLVEFCRQKKPMFFWVGWLICYSLATEVLQGLLNPICHRVFDWKDFSHDALGVLLGTLLAYYCRSFFARTK